MIKLWIEDGSGQVPSQGDLEDIATSYGMTSVPNLADDSNIWVDYESDFGIPTYTVIGPDMEILAVDTYSTNPGSWVE